MQENFHEGLRRFLTTTQAAHYLGWQPGTMRQKRLRGDGPPFYRFGNGPGARCLYELSELELWLNARRFTSTSDESAKTI